MTDTMIMHHRGTKCRERLISHKGKEIMNRGDNKNCVIRKCDLIEVLEKEEKELTCLHKDKTKLGGEILEGRMIDNKFSHQDCEKMGKSYFVTLASEEE